MSDRANIYADDYISRMFLFLSCAEDKATKYLWALHFTTADIAKVVLASGGWQESFSFFRALETECVRRREKAASASSFVLMNWSYTMWGERPTHVEER